MSSGTETQGSSRRDESEAEIRVGWRMGGLGMEVAGQMVAGAALGWLFDRWRGTGSIGLLAGSLIGIVVGLWSLVRGAMKLNRQLERGNPSAGRAKPLPPDENDDSDDSQTR